jgi:hypothetical protein
MEAAETGETRETGDTGRLLPPRAGANNEKHVTTATQRSRKREVFTDGIS